MPANCVGGGYVKKLWANPDAALEGIVKDGMLLAIGGFGLCGVPEALIEAVERSGARGLSRCQQ